MHPSDALALELNLDRYSPGSAEREIRPVPRAPQAAAGTPVHRALQPRIGKHLARTLPLLGTAHRQPCRRPRARAVMRPRRWLRRRRRRHGQACHPHAPARRDQQRPVTAEHPLTPQPPLPLQATGMRPRHPIPPPHRRTPRPHRSRPHPHQPSQPGKRRRSSPQLRPSLSHPPTPTTPTRTRSLSRPALAPHRFEPPDAHQLQSRTTRTNTWRAGGPALQPTAPTRRDPTTRGAGAVRGTPRCHDLRGGEQDTLSGLLQLTACDKQLHSNPGFGRRRPAATSREEAPSSTQADRCQSLVGAPRAPSSLPARAAGRRSQAAPTTLDERADSQVC